MNHSAPEEPRIVIAELDDLLKTNDLVSLGQRPFPELRALRDRLGEVETGLSYGRRLAQGRLDIVMAETASRATGHADSNHELVARLPEVLSGNSRSSDLPRPIRETEIPEFVDEIVAGLDSLFGMHEVENLEIVPDEHLADIAVRLADYERAVSAKRLEVHRIIDEVQEEIISRYRSGAASVDDLLH